MNFETSRLILRPWEDSDAADLFEFAADPRIGLNAGWPPHDSLAMSAEVIRDVLDVEDTYAIELKENGRVIGSVGLKTGTGSDLVRGDDQAEIGYWVAVPYWGQGLMGEATQPLIDYAFEVLGMKTLWCSAFAENAQSQRVQEKLGFIFDHKIEGQLMPLIDQEKDLLVSRLDAPVEA